MSSDHRLDDAGAEHDAARLVAAAGPRPDVSAEVAPLRDAVHAAWRGGLERRQHRRAVLRRRVFALAAAAPLLVAAGWLAVRLAGRADLATTSPATLATVLRVVGEASLLSPDGTASPLETGSPVRAGDRIVTAALARVALGLGEERSVRLDRDTEVTLRAADRVELARGEVYVASEAGAAGNLAVATALGLAREIGTRFAVELRDPMGAAVGGAPDQAELSVRVRDGAVVLERDGDRQAVSAGEELVRAADGTTARRPLPASDPSWEWTLKAAPPFELEGRAVAEYLAWIERETGWRVVYGSSGAASAAASTILHGSLAGDDPRETLDAVLPSADLRYRLEGATLHVER